MTPYSCKSYRKALINLLHCLAVHGDKITRIDVGHGLMKCLMNDGLVRISGCNLLPHYVCQITGLIVNESESLPENTIRFRVRNLDHFYKWKIN